MNQYGRRAQRYWQQNLPRQYGQIKDPTAFFDEMGQTMSQRIEDLAETIAGRSPLPEDFMSRLGRLNMARQEAETEVFREMLPQPESIPPQREDEPTGA